MVGGGIFAVLGTAVGLAGGGTPVAFLIAGLVALLTSYAYAKLSVHFPCAGGTIVFVDEAFGVDLATGTLNLMLWLSYLVTIALYAAAFGAYGSTFLSDATDWQRHLLISVGILLPAIINVLNSEIVSKSETVIVLVKLTLLGLVIGAGAPDVNWTKLAPIHWPGPLELIVGGMVIFVAYEGFELIANAGEDVRNPEYTLPRAFYLLRKPKITRWPKRPNRHSVMPDSCWSPSLPSSRRFRRSTPRFTVTPALVTAWPRKASCPNSWNARHGIGRSAGSC
jgi:hypothetical protein